MVDVSKDGDLSLNVTAEEPCYLTLVNNNKQNSLDWTITGTNVSADIMKLNFPFNTTKEMKVKTFTMATANDIVFLYIGATQIKDSSVKLSWITPKAPVTPSTPISAVTLKQTLTFIALFVIGLAMI